MNNDALQTLVFMIGPLLPVAAILYSFLIFLIGWWLPRWIYKKWELTHGYSFTWDLLSRLVIPMVPIIFIIYILLFPSIASIALLAAPYAIGEAIIWTVIAVFFANRKRKHERQQ